VWGCQLRMNRRLSIKVIVEGKVAVGRRRRERFAALSAILDRLGYEVRAFSSYGEAAACLEREIFDMVVVRPGDLKL